MAEDMGEKTELPTGRRIQDARDKGQVAKSTDLAAAIELIAAVILLAVLGGFMVRTLHTIMLESLAPSASSIMTGELLALVRSAGGQALIIAAPLLGVTLLVAAAANLVQTGALLTTEPLSPDLNRLNPITGLGRLFNLKGQVRLLSSLLKVSIMSAVGVWYISRRIPDMLQLASLDLLPGIALMLKLIVELLIWLLAVMLIIGLCDYLYQRWQYMQDLKMTRQEVTDERKSMEGDPEMKARRFRMARQMALQRVNQAVPKADVIVTNPTHFSVALRYDAETMAAPRVVAKGVDFLAMRIRQIAMTHGVPIVERPPLARALYYGVEIGQDVPAEHYQAVAELLAYVYRLDETNRPRLTPPNTSPETMPAAG
ncbi:MAG: flagellar biosynthesis protein FlhB [Planctomycetota bacterium]|nr:flagellar biosynthesis protein FlhB [Planctomycetota bacterium]